MVIVLLLLLWFMFSIECMLLLTSTLRDILMFRMVLFSSSVILFILESTLITIITVWRRLNRKRQICRTGVRLMQSLTLFKFSGYRGIIKSV